ncbi:type II secretion system F family protein [Oceanirhabdus seepicola]|uniref:Type II secretion system F family protein n=1 Tax=Oceanirhabdus seepicola TaxID=2828781 RepID=A0A9J6NW86_9CLOT|nr:type II secretion system F family protein [Oceanirhabdus seepicola]MCM1988185.1 type II secretion system F family protein [Oceanirhabdus seepicola]
MFFFVFCFLLIISMFYYFILSDKRIERRIDYYLEIDKREKKLKNKKEKLSVDKSSLKRLNEIIREKLSNLNQEKTEQMLRSAGVHLNSEEYIMLKWLLATIMGGILYFIANNMIFLILGGIIGYKSPEIWIKRKIKIRILKFNEGLPDMITTIIGSLRSGYSFPQALKVVAEECESPIREEIKILLKEMSYGITMEDALNNLSTRMPSDDLEIMIQAVLIQRQVGGNLAEVLETIVKTIRERIRIQRQVQTLTSQGRLSGRVIGSLPIILGLMIYLINPEYMQSLFENTLGIIMISVGVISGLIGFLLINKLTKIEV